MKKIPIVMSAVFVFALAAALPADDPQHPAAAAAPGQHPIHSLHGEAFDDGPRQRAVLIPGMGDEVHFPVTTSVPQAQKFFDQGVAQLHTFYYFEAERSFRQAALLDPELVMAYWGMAMANANNDRRARAFLATAREGAAKLSARERLYVDALAAHLDESKGDAERYSGFVKGLEAVILANPDDIEAKAFLGWVLVSNLWRSGDSASRVAIDSLLAEVLRRAPHHPGAHHYRIHLWDGAKPEVALESALAYASAAPGIAHAWHMPGHIFHGLSRFSEAAYQQEASARVDHAHMLANAILPFEIHNYAHNHHYLIIQLGHLGRVQDGIAYARNLIETPPHDGGDKWPRAQGRMCLLGLYSRYERWSDLLSDPWLDGGDEPQDRAWRAYGRGLARLGMGRLERAREEAEAMEKAMTPPGKKLAEAGKGKEGEPEVDSPLGAARLELRGRLRIAEGKLMEGFELLQLATKLQTERFPHDLAGFPRPLLEVLGQEHLRARDFGLAEASFRAELDVHHGAVPALAGLVETLSRSGKDGEAAIAYRDYQAARKEADRDIVFEERLAPFAAALAAAVPAPVPAAAAPVIVAAGHSPAPAGPAGPAGPPVALETLGPRLWAPAPAPEFTALDPQGKEVKLSGFRGKYVVLLFHLGAACPHCREQLVAVGKEKEALARLDAQVLALSEDTPGVSREALAGAGGADLPAVLLSDPGRKIARLYRAHDTFEDLPLHATVLIDRHGGIRWWKAGPEPFKDVGFLKSEIERVERLSAPPRRRLEL